VRPGEAVEGLTDDPAGDEDAGHGYAPPTMMKRLRRRRAAAVPAVALVALAGAVPALAASKNGITPVSPKKGATVPVNTRPTFKVKVSGPGTVWIHVCKSKRKLENGLICSDELIQQMKRRGGRASVKPKMYSFPGFWLQTPGTYYWQVHRIHCTGSSDCSLEGPTLKFKIG